MVRVSSPRANVYDIRKEIVALNSIDLYTLLIDVSYRKTPLDGDSLEAKASCLLMIQVKNRAILDRHPTQSVSGPHGRTSHIVLHILNFRAYCAAPAARSPTTPRFLSDFLPTQRFLAPLN